MGLNPSSRRGSIFTSTKSNTNNNNNQYTIRVKPVNSSYASSNYWDSFLHIHSCISSATTATIPSTDPRIYPMNENNQHRVELRGKGLEPVDIADDGNVLSKEDANVLQTDNIPNQQNHTRIALDQPDNNNNSNNNNKVTTNISKLAPISLPPKPAKNSTILSNWFFQSQHHKYHQENEKRKDLNDHDTDIENQKSNQLVMNNNNQNTNNRTSKSFEFPLYYPIRRIQSSPAILTNIPNHRLKKKHRHGGGGNGKLRRGSFSVVRKNQQQTMILSEEELTQQFVTSQQQQQHSHYHHSILPDDSDDDNSIPCHWKRIGNSSSSDDDDNDEDNDDNVIVDESNSQQYRDLMQDQSALNQSVETLIILPSIQTHQKFSAPLQDTN
jgi:hypothetical protein